MPGRQRQQSWADFRTKLLAGVAREYVIEPAKETNPKVKVIIKYPKSLLDLPKPGKLPCFASDCSNTRPICPWPATHFKQIQDSRLQDSR